MSSVAKTSDGASTSDQRTDQQPSGPYQIDEKQFENWELRWNTKQDVIDHFLQELETAMVQGQVRKVPTLRLVSDEDDD
ncbi:hypothetical protein [Thalassoglobus sp.]|uniref:hypothetical protein n=1 Tax=Thalassoglobus sp. TaxID=2795869 RepID=UPI003AA87DF9